MTRTVYEQHDAAFSNVAAYVIQQAGTGQIIGQVTMKFPRGGEGRLTAFVKLDGIEMVKGWAQGGNYDKRSAAVMSASKDLAKAIQDYTDKTSGPEYAWAKGKDRESIQNSIALAKSVYDVISAQSGTKWHYALGAAGFIVYQVL